MSETPTVLATIPVDLEGGLTNDVGRAAQTTVEAACNNTACLRNTESAGHATKETIIEAPGTTIPVKEAYACDGTIDGANPHKSMLQQIVRTLTTYAVVFAGYKPLPSNDGTLEDKLLRVASAVAKSQELNDNTVAASFCASSQRYKSLEGYLIDFTVEELRDLITLQDLLAAIESPKDKLLMTLFYNKYIRVNQPLVPASVIPDNVFTSTAFVMLGSGRIGLNFCGKLRGATLTATESTLLLECDPRPTVSARMILQLLTYARADRSSVALIDLSECFLHDDDVADRSPTG
jgi:hypothetical protein